MDERFELNFFPKMFIPGGEAMDTEFDFEYWAKLAETDPEAFEKKRRAAVDELILSMPDEHQARMKQLQWKIDAVREVSPNPLASCMRIYDMLMDRTYGDGGLLDSLNELVAAYHDSPDIEKKSFSRKNGRLLEFRTRNRKTAN